MISGLALPHAGILSVEERRRNAERIAESLFAAWGDIAGRWSRSYAQDLELTRLALLAGDAEIVAVCAEDAVTALERRLLNREAAKLGRGAIALLDENGVAVPIGLLRKTAEICELIGDTATARELYGRAREAIASAEPHGLQLQTEDHATVLISHSRLLAQDDRIDEALEGFEQARELLSQAGRIREVAVTLGEIARIKRDRGEVDETLRLYDEALRVFEALGDVRARAVMLGDIARVKQARGEVDEARQLHEEKLRICEALGDRDGKANTLWSLAQIDLEQGEPTRAFERLVESYRINLELRRLDGVCVVGWDLGRLLCAGGALEDGRTVLERSLAGFRQLHREAEAQQVEAFLATLPPPTEDPDSPATE